MVWKCCVPGCTLKSNFPSHKLPVNCDRAYTWLRVIKRTDMIGAPKEVLAKLRICALHFSEDLIESHTRRRRLKDNAMPTLNLPEQNTDPNIDTSISNVNTIAPQEISENVQSNFDFVPVISTETYGKECDSIQQVAKYETVYMSDVHQLHNKLKQCKKTLYKKKSTILKQHQKVILKHWNKWEEITADVSRIQRTFTEMITQNFNCLPQEHQYTVENLALALTLYKTMGKWAYTYLKRVFKNIPSMKILQSVLQKLPISTELNILILKHLKNIAPKMSERDKVCILMWDKIPIQPKVTYDTRKDIICGLEDWGNNRTDKIADHALVFMLCGINSGWKMPISYNFCEKQINTTQLARCIRKHISQINSVGFHVVAIVCDQGSSNVITIEELLLLTDMKRNFKKRTRGQTFEVDNMEVIPLYDPSHLIKEIRDNFLTKDLRINCHNDFPQVASWDVIKTAWIMDRRLNTIRPQLKKVKKHHILENKIKKTRVKHATQVLSGTVASCIEMLTRSKYVVPTNNGILSINTEDGLATAEAVNFFNNLFDSVNGKETSDNELRCPVMENSAHHAFWADARNILCDMFYINKVTRQVKTSVPTLQKWLFTIEGFQKIWQTLHSTYNFQNLKTRYCSQDAIENFLNQIRSHAVHHMNPTPRQFEHSFITLLVSNAKSLSIIGGNCEIIKDDSMLFSLEECLKDDVSNNEMYDDHNKDIHDEPQEMFTNKVVHEASIVILIFECLEDIITSILKEFEYCQQCNSSLRKNEFLACARQIICMLNKLLKTRSHQRNILKVLLQCFDNWYIDMDWHECLVHHDSMFKTMVRVLAIKVLVWWCKKKNVVINNKTEDIRIKGRKRVLENDRKLVHKRIKT